MNIHALRNAIDEEIVDFNQLKAVLHNYAHAKGGMVFRWYFILFPYIKPLLNSYAHKKLWSCPRVGLRSTLML